jgi:hypothetical protein
MAGVSDAYPQPPGWLAAIPGYSGYHAKEQRRLADRALREELARRVTASIQQLQRLSAALARARRLADLAPVDGLTSRLQHFNDRLTTAPEGYRGLFEQERVDEAALDQILAFDRSLAAGIERLAVVAATLTERTPAPLLDSPAGVELVELVERLHQRLDARHTVMTEGRALTPESALAVLQPPARPVPQFNLKPGDAASYGGQDYVVDAVISYRGDRDWTEYRLRDASAERWLVVDGGRAALLSPAASEPVGASDSATFTHDGRDYRLVAHGQATAALTGPSGRQPNVPVTFRDYEAGEARLAVREWGAERHILVGEAIDLGLVSTYPRA